MIEIVLSAGPNSIDVSLPSQLRMETAPVSEHLFFVENARQCGKI
jgi:hypothetical protein